MINLTDNERGQLGNAVRKQRLALGKGQEEIARANGVSLTTWNLIELGKQDNYRELTLSAVFRALGWRGDALDFILKGEAPPLEDSHSPPMRLPPPIDRRRSVENIQADMQEMLDAAYENEGLRVLEGDQSLAEAVGRAIMSEPVNTRRIDDMEDRLTRLEEKVDRFLAEPDDSDVERAP